MAAGLRQRLRRVVLDSDTRAGRLYNLIIFGTILASVAGLMVVIESGHPNTQFQTVGQGVYWAIVTMTTVGYGDFVPQTVLGRVLAAVVMLLGFGIIAIPTGIVTVETINQAREDQRDCISCGRSGHRPRAAHCDQCGALLPQGLNS
jgi:voltage-gated potassium channel